MKLSDILSVDGYAKINSPKFEGVKKANIIINDLAFKSTSTLICHFPHIGLVQTHDPLCKPNILFPI